MAKPIPLHDGDYVVEETGIWLTVENLSIRIWKDNFHKAVDVRVFHLGDEDSAFLASLRVPYEKDSEST